MAPLPQGRSRHAGEAGLSPPRRGRSRSGRADKPPPDADLEKYEEKYEEPMLDPPLGYLELHHTHHQQPGSGGHGPGGGGGASPPLAWQEKRNMALLVLLYMMQGVPLGLTTGAM